MMNGSNKSPVKKSLKSSGSSLKRFSKPSTRRTSSSSINDLLTTQNSDHSVSEKLLTNSSFQNQLLKKPISLIILEKYFSDICYSISSQGSIDHSLLKKLNTMKEVLKDLLSAIPDISLDVYVLMSSSLKDLQTIKDSNLDSPLSSLLNKLGNIAIKISENKFRNRVEKSPTNRAEAVYVINEEPEDLEKELDVKVSRVTARVLNIWKKIVSPQKEAEVICYCFLLLYSEIDRTIKVSPVIKSKFDKPTDIMKNYLNNPGNVVTIIRHTKDYIQRELISVQTIKKIFSFLEKITIERIRSCDKTLTGYVLYELVFYSVMYYAFHYKQQHGIDLFDKKINYKKIKGLKNIVGLNSEGSIICTEADNIEEHSQDEGFNNDAILVFRPDKGQRASSQPAMRGLKAESSVKKVKKSGGLESLKEKVSKKKLKIAKDKEFVSNLKKKFRNSQDNEGLGIITSEFTLGNSSSTPITSKKISSSPKRAEKRLLN